ncbi:AEC family transporter [Pseudooceanicola sp.]|uniref:AEC family transporter n=1 Tax=Pseudooceanicola sp. TaxID=1914328 RepID=UPI002614E407|nr:AEC family transporter [Pseudooceanicola sp.]MDF1854590.1 AEC family transporter [Pseudooceanicola sp.]
MNLALTVLEIVAPVFLLAAIGLVWVKAGFEYRVEFVTRLAMTLSVPCLIFTALMKTRIESEALTGLLLAAIAAYAVLTLAAALLVWIVGLDARSYLAPLIFGNTGNLGLPLALFAFGEIGLSYAVVVFAVMAVWSFTFGIWVVSGGGSVTRALKEPLLWATLLGGLFLWQGWVTPRWLTNTLELTGQMAIPMMLITLGVAVARLNAGRMLQASLLALVKVVLCTGVAWGLGRLFHLDDVAFAVLVLQVATPVAVTSYLLAEKYGADSEAVAGLVVASTLASVLYLPLLLAAVL